MPPSILSRIVASTRQEVAASRDRVPLSILVDTAAAMPPPIDFAAAIRNHPAISLIAEVKKASPSAGIIREDFDPPGIARIYQREGAQCISVLTDREFFAGDLEYLRQIRQAVSLPLLRKDFIIDEYQVYEARAAGADAVLLIAECLDPNQMQDLHDRITSLGMTPLVEFYESGNLDSVLDCKPVLVGVNNRDLNSFQVDLGHSIRMRERVPREILFVSESGIRTHEDVLQLAAHHVDAMLVGESLTRQTDIAVAMRLLLQG